jgi:hypothetical protein
MAVVFTTTRARFEDVCTVEEALPLLEFLRSGDDVEVDLSACTYLHTALIQLLLTARPRMTGSPADPALARWVAPLLTGPNIEGDESDG